MTTPDDVQNIVFQKGKSWVRTFLLRDPLTGDVRDLGIATCDVELRIFKKYDPAFTPIVLSKSGGNTAFFTDGSDGLITFRREASETVTWEPGIYSYEVVYKDTSQTPQTDDIDARGTALVQASRTGA